MSDDAGDTADTSTDIEETQEAQDTGTPEISDSELEDLPMIEETPELPDESLVDSSDAGLNDLPVIEETPEEPDNSKDQVTFHPQHGIEIEPSPEGEPNDTPYTQPEVPYGGMGGERRG